MVNSKPVYFKTKIYIPKKIAACKNKCWILESKKVRTLFPKIIRVTSNQLHHMKAINFDIPYHLH